MKKYLMGLALSGLATRLNKKTRAVRPWHKRAVAPMKTSSFLLGAGVGAGVYYLLSHRLGRNRPS